MGLRVPFALVPFGFNSPIKFIIYIYIHYHYVIALHTVHNEPVPVCTIKL